MAPRPAAGSGSSSLFGILLFSLTTLAFASLDTLAKYMTREFHVVQIAWGRYVFHALLLLAFAPRHGLLRPLRSSRPWLQIFRSGLLALVTLLFFTAISFLPLTDAVAIGYVAPLALTAMAAFVLKERVGLRRWTAICVGFLGVLIVIRPGFGVVHWAAFIALAMALGNACYHLATRMLSGVDSAQTTFFYTGLVGAVGLSLAVPFFWTTPDLFGWMQLVGVGLFGGLGHYLLIRAYDHAAPAVLAPYTYASIVWVTLFGFILFGDLPDAWTVAGAAIIIASGIYVFYREAHLRRLGKL